MIKFKLSLLIFTLAIVLAGTAGISIVFLHQGLAQKIFNAFFWMEVLGVAVYLWETKQENAK